MDTVRRPATRIRRNPWSLAAGAMPGMVMLALVPFGGPFLPFVFLAPAALFFGVERAWAWNKVARRTEGVLSIDDQDVHFSSDVIAARSRLRNASWRVDATFGPVVELDVRRRGSVVFALASGGDARSVVEALGFDVTRRTSKFTAMSRFAELSRRRQLGLSAGMLSLPLAALLFPRPLTYFTVFFGSIVLIGIGAAIMGWSSSVEVGTDRIVFRWLGTSRFVDLGDVAGVRPLDEPGWVSALVGVELLLVDGGRRVIPMHTNEIGVAERGRLLARIEDALAARESSLAHVTTSLARHGLGSTDWIVRLRAISSGAAADHRTPPVSHDQLWRILDDPAVSAIDRTAAAIAVATGASDEDRERIRLVARASASARMRIALERAADPASTEDALAEALAAVEAESSSVAVRGRHRS